MDLIQRILNMLDKLKTLYTKFLQTLANFKSLLSKDISELWDNYKSFLLVFGAIVLTVKFRQILIDLIVKASKSLFNSAEKKSSSLQEKEDINNKKADELVKESENLPQKEEPTNDDWYKKK